MVKTRQEASFAGQLFDEDELFEREPVMRDAADDHELGSMFKDHLLRTPMPILNDKIQIIEEWDDAAGANFEHGDGEFFYKYLFFRLHFTIIARLFHNFITPCLKTRLFLDVYEYWVLFFNFVKVIFVDCVFLYLIPTCISVYESFCELWKFINFN
jgi:hypothetical protein